MLGIRIEQATPSINFRLSDGNSPEFPGYSLYLLPFFHDFSGPMMNSVKLTLLGAFAAGPSGLSLNIQ